MANDPRTKYPWYEVVSGTGLEQGDIIRGCPVFLIPPEAALESEQDRSVTIEEQNVIVMTQSCDLAMRDDGTCIADDAILSPIYFRHELAGDRTYGNSGGWEAARKGRHVRYHVLNRCDIHGNELDFMLVDLGRIYSLSVGLVRGFAAAKERRVRLLPPYREHLSQAFARTFMRVGLPADIPMLS